jgi:hypothetical protein
VEMLENKIGARGFEPPTSWSRTKRSSQAEPRPDDKPKQFSTRSTTVVALQLCAGV